MKEADVRKRAFAMPFTSPAYPPGPYRFYQREFLVITYRTDADTLRALVPEPLEVDEPIVKYEFIRMPDSTGFGDYTETGQVIPVSFRGRKGGYSHCMFLNDDPPIAGGRELWGFPKKLAQPSLRAEIDTLVGTLDYGPVRVATGTMGYKHKTGRSDGDKGFARGAELSPQDHSACRRHAAHLRTGRVLPRRYRSQRRLDRTGRARSSRPRAGAGRRASGARNHFGYARHCGFDAGPRQGGLRLLALSAWAPCRPRSPIGEHAPDTRLGFAP